MNSGLGNLVSVLKKIERNQRRYSNNPPEYTVHTEAEYTIAGGIITLTGYNQIRYMTIDTQADAASDDLDTISGGVAGDLIICRAAHTDRTVVVKHNTGNMRLNGAADFSLDSSSDTIMLIYTGAIWTMIANSNNA